jgi:hypothetical protein
MPKKKLKKYAVNFHYTLWVDAKNKVEAENIAKKNFELEIDLTDFNIESERIKI